MLGNISAQTKIRKSDGASVEFKTAKTVGQQQNIYFDIVGITNESQFDLISKSLEENTEVISCNIYASTRNTNRCMLISTLNVNAVEIRTILVNLGLDYLFQSVIINDETILINSSQN